MSLLLLNYCKTKSYQKQPPLSLYYNDILPSINNYNDKMSKINKILDRFERENKESSRPEGNFFDEDSPLWLRLYYINNRMHLHDECADIQNLLPFCVDALDKLFKLKGESKLLQRIAYYKGVRCDAKHNVVNYTFHPANSMEHDYLIIEFGQFPIISESKYIQDIKIGSSETSPSIFYFNENQNKAKTEIKDVNKLYFVTPLIMKAMFMTPHKQTNLHKDLKRNKFPQLRFVKGLLDNSIFLTSDQTESA